jgi:type I restriction-modification system DNA methylase subunit
LGEPPLERQQTVLNILQNLKGIEPLKQLFWSDLNYDRVNKSLPRRGWKDNVSGLLADDPVLLASGANDFHVIYGRLASDRLLMGDERAVVSRLLQEHPYSLFVFSNSMQEHFHFLNVKYDDEVQKRRMFRRITVGPNERLRTASERIALLDLSDISPDLFGLSPLAVQQRHDQAFDVEPVTKEFFSEYRRIFEDVEEAITGCGRDEERKRLYTQRLFNRLMFIAFIQKKGWLKFNGESDYLSALWSAHLKDNAVSDKNFYRDRLKALFFFGLNASNEVNQIGINKGAFLKTLIGDVPYLNGGLFEEDDDDKDKDIKVPDKAIGAVLNELFANFNFTVTESTPLDVEIAVDPEMLGKIFEELVTGRHETGSYYTPKIIVSFMCREALKGYLEAQVPDEAKDAIDVFVEERQANKIKDAEKVLDALRRIRVCDPACGSGAYLLGMLHELLDLRQALFQTRKLDAKSVYDRKLEMIQTNVYGVDTDPFAVNIARLRLWLSLAVDFDGARPEPLPNLDYKVEIGDSLIGPDPSGGLEMGFRKQLIDEFLKAKGDYLTTHYSHKKELKKQIEKLKKDIASFGGHRQSEGFDWAVEFAEVFLHGGFDTVIGNPPYVGGRSALQNLGREYKDFLSSHYKSAVGVYDLYVLFWEVAFRLASKTGVIALITPNKLMVADYATSIRRIIAAHKIQSFADVSDLCPFEAASVYPVILAARGDKAASDHKTHLHVDLERLDQLVPANRQDVLQASVFSPEGKVWAVRSVLHSKGSSFKPLATVAKVHGGITGFAAQGLLNALTEGKRTKSSIPFIVTGNIDPYLCAFGSVRYMNHSFEQPFLIPDFDYVSQGKWELFLKQKIVVAGMSKRLEAAMLNEPVAVGVAVYSVTDWQVDPYFLLAVLNSDVVSEWYRQEFRAKHLAGGFLAINKGQLEQVPIPDVDDETQQELGKLVRRYLQAGGNSRSDELRKQIEESVAKLYPTEKRAK